MTIWYVFDGGKFRKLITGFCCFIRDAAASSKYKLQEIVEIWKCDKPDDRKAETLISCGAREIILALTGRRDGG